MNGIITFVMGESFRWLFPCSDFSLTFEGGEAFYESFVCMQWPYYVTIEFSPRLCPSPCCH